MFHQIPVIDLGDSGSADGRRRIVEALDNACRTAGFFHLAGHGIPASLVAQTFDWSRRFFALPADVKTALHLSRSRSHRGYEAVGDQRLDPAMHPDLKESYYCGIDYPEEHPFVQRGHAGYGGNLWPGAALPGFREAMLDYIAAMTALGDRVMALLAQAMRLPPAYFAPLYVDPMVALRLLRYPPHPEGGDPRDIGAGAHTDYGALTLLAQDEHGGLEVLNPDGRWIAVPPRAGAFVVNIGDMVPRWTNNAYRSNPHRVINRNPDGKPRYSLPFFHGPRYDARIRCVPSFLPLSGLPAWPDCTAGEHLLEQYRRTYGKTLETEESAEGKERDAGEAASSRLRPGAHAGIG
jgi:isopenicillin N synthase-like dioxygenase